ncbi:MAG: hypothetical protein GY796_34620 [Chloroflexi bacterium]|nr:hypothetical protein [Chloroflexota bacterium]
MIDNSQNPYVGPRPFERQDSDRFFGRDQESNELLSLIVANRTLVLYAQSGAGKTSLLNAQVTPLLEDEGFEVFPFARVQGPELEKVNADEISNIYTFYTLLSWTGEETDAAELSTQTIAEFLAARPHPEDEFGYERPRVIIFDQFEELFTTYPARWPERESFLNQISRALKEDPLLRVVFSLREDYVAQLEPYAHLLPRHLRTRFRLERMRPGAALAAVRGPLNNTDSAFAPGVAEQLVEDLRTVRLESLSGELQTVTGEFVEPVQLQVVCQNLWEDLPDNVTLITEEHLRAFGDVDQALSSFYERAVGRALPQAGVDEEALRQWFEASLITPAGTRSTVYRGTSNTAGIGNTAVQTLENMHIIRGEFRAGSRWYELTHDRLIDPIQTSNQQWQYDRQQARIHRIRRIATTAVGIIALVAICSFLVLFLIQLSNGGNDNVSVGQTATAYVAVVDEAATEVLGTATAQEAMAADAQSTAAIAETTIAETSTVQANANDAATREAELRETAAAQTAVAQQTIEAEIVAAAETATIEGIARATSDAQATLTSAEATKTAEDFSRAREPVRPLQPGISIGSLKSATAGTLSAFVKDSEGNYYLLGPVSVLNEPLTQILQPSPIDGGQIENVVAQTGYIVLVESLAPIEQTGITPIITPVDAVTLIEKAQLLPDVSFQTTVPGIGPILGTREPEDGMEVLVVGRTAGIKESTIFTCPDGCEMLTQNGIVTAPFAVADRLNFGDEGALVITKDGYALGIVTNTAGLEDYSLMTPLAELLETLNVEMVFRGEALHTFTTHKGVTWDVAFSPDGRWLASGGDDDLIHLQDMQDLTLPPQELQGHTDSVLGLAFSPDGRWLASAGKDLTIRVWPIGSNDNEVIVLQNGEPSHLDWIWDIAFSPDGTNLATASQDNTVRLWSMSSRRQNVAVLPHDDTVFNVAYSPDGKILATAAWDRSVHLWDLTASEPVEVGALRHNDWAFGVAFSPDGKWLATSSSDGTVRLWNILSYTYPTSQETADPDGQVLAELGTTARSLAFSADGRHLAAGTDDHLVYQWDTSNWEAQPLVMDGDKRVTAVAYHPATNRLAASLGDGRVVIWLIR